MRVVIFSDYESFGGAAVAASRLAEALTRAGVEVIRIVGQKNAGDYPWTTKVLRVGLPEKALIKAVGKISRHVATNILTRLICEPLDDLLEELKPDIINVHNLHGAGWGPDLIPVCARHAPMLWTLHDMWSFTGRCAYSYDCRKFTAGCDASSPTPREYPTLTPARIAGAWQQRQRLLTEHPHLVAVCPSRWLAQEALNGLWAGHHVEVIPNGLPLKVYQSLDRELARASIGIKTTGPVLLTAAQSLTERRKGSAILIKALQHVSSKPLTLVTLGQGKLSVETDGVHVCSLGYIDHERTKVLAYNVAEIFVHPAPVDNLPNTIMEAISCGTPVVGFPVGGVPDIVRVGLTGWLGHEVSPEALAIAINTALTDVRHSVNLRASCRTVAEAEYSSDLQARRYLALFETLLQAGND